MAGEWGPSGSNTNVCGRGRHRLEFGWVVPDGRHISPDIWPEAGPLQSVEFMIKK
jgi:hypothetical protein